MGKTKDLSGKFHFHKSIFQQILVFFAVVGIVFGGLFLYWITHRPKEYVFSDHLSEEVITIDSKKITLKDISYYIMDVESYVNQQAITYNSDNPLDYWNTHFSAGDDSDYVFEMAKTQVYETCVSDYLYEMAANSNEFALTKRQINTAKNEATDLFQSMTDKQKQSTELTLEEIETMKIREALASAYAEYLSDHVDWSDTVLSPSTELSYDGNYFTDKIKNTHKIFLNKTVWNKVRMGEITIN